MKKEKIKEWIKKYAKWIVLFICLIAFLAIAEDVLEKEIMKMDIFVYYITSKYIISDSITPIFKVITNLGGAFVLVAIAVLSLAIVKNKRIGICTCSNLAIITLLNQLLKNIVQRPRPNEYRIIEETGYSFPSGHSMVSVAFYGFIIYLVYKYVKNEKVKWILITILACLVPLIGFSRIYLGVHYTSDVLAGACISISYLILFTHLIKPWMVKGDKNMTNLRRKRRFKVKTKKIANSFKYAVQGLISSFKTEKNMKIHILIMFLVILAGWWLKISKIEWIVCIILFGIVISAELVNTAIETIVDMITPYRNKEAKLAKDIAAASVLVVAISAAVVGLMIFVPKICEIWKIG